MNFDAITPELLEKAQACKTPQEFISLAQDYGVELTDTELDAIAGGDAGGLEDIGPKTREALEKMTPEEREMVKKIDEGIQKWADSCQPGWQGK